MTPEDILNRLQELLPDGEFELDETKPEPALRVSVKSLLTVADKLKSDPRLIFDSLQCLSGVDLGQTLQAVYHFYSNHHGHHIALRCVVPKDNPELPSVSRIWPAADWHEREAFDLLGIQFQGHPDLRRILCPEDWEGHPLRKDYKAPEEYHGIPLTAVLPPESSRE